MQIVLEPFDSLEAYDAWLYQQPDGEYFEVVDGIPVVSPGPTGYHQLALARMFALLQAASGAGVVVLPAPWDWVVRERPRLNIRQPDLVVIRRGQVDVRLFDVPLLAVEVLSPSTLERDVITKRAEYAGAGLEHYWVVDPIAPSVTIYTRKGEELGLVGRFSGDQEIRIDQPFVMRFKPSDLIA